MLQYYCRRTFNWCVFICSYIPSLIAVLLILANVCPYYFFFLPRLHRTYINGGNVSLLYCIYCHVFMALAIILIFINFFLCIIKSPGYVERGVWSEMPVYNENLAKSGEHEVSQLTSGGNLRYCVKCEIYKPDNAHHCRVCRRCVYNMDHHCPWINNCVGRNNTKFFLLFLSYIPLGGFHIFFTMTYSCFYHFNMSNEDDMRLNDLNIFAIFLSFFMSVTFLIFASHFLLMACRGQSTIGNRFFTQKSTAATTTTTASAISTFFSFFHFLRGEEKDERQKKKEEEERRRYLNDIFGGDRRWWRLICPFAVVREEKRDEQI